jgi:dTDP-4-dehydrorhamnose 3,5-epimerase
MSSKPDTSTAIHPSGPRSDWSLGGVRDAQTVTPDWEPADDVVIHGVVTREIRSVPTATGTLTEIYRADWKLDALPVAQVFQRSLDPGSVSAWHAHALATDRLFCASGRVRLALYDGRRSSPSHGALWVRIFGRERPLLVVVPPGVWHGVQALSNEPALIVNAVDHAFDYESPDHWRLPPDTGEIPYRFPG